MLYLMWRLVPQITSVSPKVKGYTSQKKDGKDLHATAKISHILSSASAICDHSTFTFTMTECPREYQRKSPFQIHLNLRSTVAAYSQSLLLLLLFFLSNSSGSSAFSTSSPTMSSSSANTQPQHLYPRPLHPGGFSLPPLVEDRLPIITTFSSPPPTNDGDHNVDKKSSDGVLQTNILLIKPPDMESLWEWFTYTKHQSDCDPSWGRVWPTALSLGRMVLRSLHDEHDYNDGEMRMRMDNSVGGSTSAELVNNEEQANNERDLIQRAMHALRTSSHVVEVGCGLGVAGLVYASSMADILSSSDAQLASKNDCKNRQRTITFLDREPYALHCVMASASTNGLMTGPLIQPPAESAQEEAEDIITSTDTNNGHGISSVTARAAIDDWTLPTSADNILGQDNDSPIKNICYQDLHLNALVGYDNQNTILLASDILYEPSSMTSLATKLESLLHPIHGGYALIADPQKERTIGCRDSFVESVHDLGGEVDILPLSDLENDDDNNGVMLLEGDMDIDGSLAKTVLIVVRFDGTNAE